MMSGLFGFGRNQGNRVPDGPGAQAGPAAGPVGAAAAAGVSLLRSGRTRTMTQERLARARETLTKYKDGKTALENRLIEEEQWYRLRHWEYLRRKKEKDARTPEPTSAWLFDSIAQKHADAMDNFPVPAVLPREESDRQSAQLLSDILPVVLERADFEQVYNDNWWEKLKHGTAVYGVFWDSDEENGLGDVVVRDIDLLNIFWEPGKRDIQASRSLFIVSLVDKDLLAEEYPRAKGSMDSQVITVSEYIHDENIDTASKALVVDWYYKVKSPSGRTILHYCKFVGDTVLEATEDDPEYRETGLYDHGLYPVVFDVLFPDKDSPAGFGYIAVAKDPQLYIDKLSGAVLQNALMCAKPRFFRSAQTGVNMEQFCDWNQDIVDVEGSSLDETRLRQIEVQQVPGNVLDVLQLKINELKETTANRDYNAGGTTSGVTAAAAIAALQEAGNKTSRDSISGSYRAYRKIDSMVVELMRQFYDVERSFRIVGPNGGERFERFSNADIRDQELPPAVPGGETMEGYVPMFRRPVFDYDIRAQKRSPFSQMAQNEMAKEFYSLGFFNPERAQESMAALQMMDFDGHDQVMQQVQQGQTLLNMLTQATMELNMLRAVLGQRTGTVSAQAGSSAAPSSGGGTGRGIGAEALAAQTAHGADTTPYGQVLMEQSRPDMSRTSGVSVK